MSGSQGVATGQGIWEMKGDKTMRQLTFVEPGRLEWHDVPRPRIVAETDALVRPVAVGRCDLDLYIATGTGTRVGCSPARSRSAM
jgi:hypothetical protein